MVLPPWARNRFCAAIKIATHETAWLFLRVLSTRFPLKYWLPVVVWMVLIFSASGDQMSFARSSRFIGPLVHWLFPDASPEFVRGVIFVIRKGAHVTEYAVLAVMVWWALRRSESGATQPWSWSRAGLALVIAALYATTDELHQAWVPSRQGSALDVLIDTAGAVFGLLFLWFLGRWRRLW
jgi:VanZ family protein